MSDKKTNWNKRMKIRDEKKRLKGDGFITKTFTVEEVLDESGEVLEDSVIKFSFGGILIHLSIACALKLNKALSDILNLKKR